MLWTAYKKRIISRRGKSSVDYSLEALSDPETKMMNDCVAPVTDRMLIRGFVIDTLWFFLSAFLFAGDSSRPITLSIDRRAERPLFARGSRAGFQSRLDNGKHSSFSGESPSGIFRLLWSCPRLLRGWKISERKRRNECVMRKRRKTIENYFSGKPGGRLSRGSRPTAARPPPPSPALFSEWNRCAFLSETRAVILSLNATLLYRCYWWHVRELPDICCLRLPFSASCLPSNALENLRWKNRSEFVTRPPQLAGPCVLALHAGPDRSHLKSVAERIRIRVFPT